MPLFNVEDPASDGAQRAYQGVDVPAPESGERDHGKIGWLSRLAGAGARVRRVVRGALRDPELKAIGEAAAALERDGAVVFACLGGWPRPPVIQGFVPDVYAVFEDCEVVLTFTGEPPAEGTGSRPGLRSAVPSSAPSPAQRRDFAFASWAEGSPVRVYEHVVVAGSRGARG
jgi:hypothetical protein